MSVRREDKNGAERWWKSLMRRLKDLRTRTTPFDEETALQIDTGVRLAITGNVTNSAVKTSWKLKRSLNKNKLFASYLKILDQSTPTWLLAGKCGHPQEDQMLTGASSKQYFQEAGTISQMGILLCSVKKMYYIDETIKINKAYQSLVKILYLS